MRRVDNRSSIYGWIARPHCCRQLKDARRAVTQRVRTLRVSRADETLAGDDERMRARGGTVALGLLSSSVIVL